MRIDNDVKLDYSDVLLRPKRSTMGSRSEVNLIREYIFRNSGESYKGIPIMAANMDGVGTVDMAETLSKMDCFTCLTKDINSVPVSKDLSKHVAISTGVTPSDLERLDVVMQKNSHIRFICIDVANGYSERFINVVQQIREKYPSHTIIAGNVVTPDITEELLLRGADIVKVGIGPGSVCTTRIKTGVGFPQLSAVLECADAAHGLNGHIIADGGCTCPGDVVKAFAAGADFVMLGGMVAGCNQGGGKIENGKVKFYGMSSKEAQGETFKDYRSSEGRVVEVPYRGDVKPIVADILGGLRSACTYVGARKLKQLSKCTTFVKVNNQFNHMYLQHTIGE